MIDFRDQNSIKKIFYEFFSIPKGVYFEISVYCFTIGIYGISYDQFLSWWGIGLSNFQIKLLATICLIFGFILGLKFIGGVFSLIKLKKLFILDISFILKVIFLWLIILIVFILQVNNIIKIPPFLFMALAIGFAVYLDFSVKKFDRIVVNID
jgi:hypothetical protein